MALIEQVEARLAELLRANVEALVALDLALERTDHAGLYARLHRYRDAYERHLADLAVACERSGLPVARRAHDEVGRFFHDYTAWRSGLGDEAFLRGLCAVTRSVVAAHDACVGIGLPEPLCEVIRQQAEAVAHHLAELEEALAAEA